VPCDVQKNNANGDYCYCTSTLVLPGALRRKCRYI
jgi:hypothetical protein